MRRFIIAADNLRAQEFAEYLDGNGLGWWHWIENFWLVTAQNRTEISADILQNKVNAFSDSSRCIVIELHGSHTWSGHGPQNSDGGTNMFDWVLSTFDKN